MWSNRYTSEGEIAMSQVVLCVCMCARVCVHVCKCMRVQESYTRIYMTQTAELPLWLY